MNIKIRMAFTCCILLTVTISCFFQSCNNKEEKISIENKPLIDQHQLAKQYFDEDADWYVFFVSFVFVLVLLREIKASVSRKAAKKGKDAKRI